LGNNGVEALTKVCLDLIGRHDKADQCHFMRLAHV
jgi:hypothetical protein